MIRVLFSDWHDAAHIVDALLDSATAQERQGNTILAMRYRRIANDIGSELDTRIPEQQSV